MPKGPNMLASLLDMSRRVFTLALAEFSLLIRSLLFSGSQGSPRALESGKGCDPSSTSSTPLARSHLGTSCKIDAASELVIHLHNLNPRLANSCLDSLAIL